MSPQSVFTGADIEALIADYLSANGPSTEDDLRRYIDWMRGLAIDAAVYQSLRERRFAAAWDDDKADFAVRRWEDAA
jgi:hypothetical protein